MKNIKYIFTLMIAGLFVFAACQKNEPILFDNEGSFVAFEGTTGAVVEATWVDGVPQENVIEIRVMAVTLNTTAFTVNFDFSTEGLENPAHENDAFTLLNDSKTLDFPNGMGYAVIRIQTIDDDIFTDNRQVRIVLGENTAGYETGLESSFLLTVVDDEHPLNIVLGTYSVSGTDAWGGGVSTTIETSAVDGDITKIQFPLNQIIPGWGVPDEYLVYADVDLDEMMLYIETYEQDYPSWAYGPCAIVGWTDGGDTFLGEGGLIRASIDADGNISMLDYIGVRITAGNNAGLHFNIWTDDVVWTKTDKSLDPVEGNHDRILRAL